jgi:hypothetical protein
MRKYALRIASSITLVAVTATALLQPVSAIVYDKYRATPSTNTAALGEVITITGKTAAKSKGMPGDKPYPGPGTEVCTYLYVKNVPSSYRMTLTDTETGKTTSTKWPGGPGWLQLDNCTKVQPNRSFVTTLVLGPTGLGKKTYAMGDGSDDNVGVYMLPENVAASNKFVITGTN